MCRGCCNLCWAAVNAIPGSRGTTYINKKTHFTVLRASWIQNKKVYGWKRPGLKHHLIVVVSNSTLVFQWLPHWWVIPGAAFRRLCSEYIHPPWRSAVRIHPAANGKNIFHCRTSIYMYLFLLSMIKIGKIVRKGNKNFNIAVRRIWPLNLFYTIPLFYPYTILSCLNCQILFVYITNSKFPRPKYTSYFKIDRKYKKLLLIDKFNRQRQCVNLITSSILCIFSEYNLNYFIISTI